MSDVDRHAQSKCDLMDFLKHLHCDSNVEKLVEKVSGVPGAYLIKGALLDSPALLDGLRDHVRACCASDPKISTSADSLTGKRQKRRDSQLHTPVKVDASSMTYLCGLLRAYLPSRAGPDNDSNLEAEGRELSTFLRLYDYQEGDASSPHFDKAYTQNGLSGGIETFSAYSVLLYLNDGFVGGNTRFFPAASDTTHVKGRPNSRKYDGGPVGDEVVLKRSRAGNTLRYFGTRKPDDDDKGEDSTILSSSETTTTMLATTASDDTSTENGDHKAETEVDASFQQGCVDVVICRGDVLIFPHGRQAGCHPDPFHAGSMVEAGRKTIIRTDVVFRISEATRVSREKKALAKAKAKEMRKGKQTKSAP